MYVKLYDVQRLITLHYKKFLNVSLNHNLAFAGRRIIVYGVMVHYLTLHCPFQHWQNSHLTPFPVIRGNAQEYVTPASNSAVLIKPLSFLFEILEYCKTTTVAIFIPVTDIIINSIYFEIIVSYSSIFFIQEHSQV